MLLLFLPLLTLTVAQKLITIPFQAIDHLEFKTSAFDNQRVRSILANVDLAYLIQIQVGTPPQPFYLLLDTGSSSTWVPIAGCGQKCGYPYHTLQPSLSSTFRTSELPFNIHYGEGYSSGYYAMDTITVNGISIPDVNFAVSTRNDGEITMDGADGILGIGPDNLSLYDNPEKKVVPTLVTTMREKEYISRKLFSIYFHPYYPGQTRINGEIVFGGVDPKHIVGEVRYTPVSKRKEYTVNNIKKSKILSNPSKKKKKKNRITGPLMYRALK
ncbi:aspartic peptidase domain-containing protein [Sporodiniella umbellata]|nr:aspartic peptidase domain-containing protein [Sporodiniella umbellata]